MGSRVSPTEEEDVFVAPDVRHDVARVEDEERPSCDACGRPVPPEVDRPDYAIPGSAVYLWTRGDEVRFEKAPLCALCAAAIGMTALARWEIEEEEG